MTHTIYEYFYAALRRILWLLPLSVNPRKIVCDNFYGRGYSDAPAAIVDEIIARDLDYKIIWNVADVESAGSFPEKITLAKVNSLTSVYHMKTAKFWIDNCRKTIYTTKRSKQVYIQAWHGFPLKKIEQDAADKLNPYYVKMAKKDSQMCNLMLSNSTFLTHVYRNGFWYSGEILECGSPRNDVLLSQNRGRLEDVRLRLGLPPSKRLLLYAPTFRKDMGLKPYDLEYDKIRVALGKKFGGDWAILLRLHPNIAYKSGELCASNPDLYDVSQHPRMEDLLSVADALITDYSSVMFDFMITQKPVFLYANDVDEYIDERGLYFGMDRLPFVLAESQSVLIEAVATFDEKKQIDRIDTFIREFGIADKGIASQAVVSWIERTRKDTE